MVIEVNGIQIFNKEVVFFFIFFFFFQFYLIFLEISYTFGIGLFYIPDINNQKTTDLN